MSQTSENSPQKIVIVGGGSAGWMTAAALSSLLNPDKIQVTLIESEQIGTVGVGEATIPDIIEFNRFLGVSEQEFMAATHATFKLGIQFDNWGKIGDSYFHPFSTHGADMHGIDFHQYWLHSRNNGNTKDIQDYSLCAIAGHKNKFTLPATDPRSVASQLAYAYHFDATRYAQFLRGYAEKRGVKRVEGKVLDVSLNAESGNIESLKMESGDRITGDIFFDCTGFRALLSSKTLGVGYDDWTHWLPCNSAQAVACEQSGPLKPYTIATAKSAGWQWRIPTQQRTGNGHIYSTEFMTDADATDSLLADLDGDPMGTPRQLRFTTGCRKELWHKNCIAIGLSAGFLEPLESTSIFLIQMGINRFISLFPGGAISDIVRDEYNVQMRLQFEQVRDFIILHYCATERDDSEFWNYCSNMPLPDSLTRKMKLFKEAGRIFRYENELFTRPSWIAVFLGQNILPRVVDPIVATLPPQDVHRSLASMNNAMHAASDKMPTHADFIRRYCPAN